MRKKCHTQKFFQHQQHNREVPLKQLKHNVFPQIKYSKCINNNINKLYTFNNNNIQRTSLKVFVFTFHGNNYFVKVENIEFRNW